MQWQVLNANVTAEEYSNALQRWVANSTRRVHAVKAVLIAKNQITGRCEVLHKSFDSPQTIASLPTSTTHVVFFGQPLHLVANALHVPLDSLKSDVMSELDKFMNGVLSRITVGGGTDSANWVITNEHGSFIKFIVHKMAMFATLCSEDSYRATQKKYTIRDFVLMLAEEIRVHYKVVIKDIQYSTHAVDTLLSAVGDCTATVTTSTGSFFKLNVPVLCDEGLQRMSCIEMEQPLRPPMERIQDIIHQMVQEESKNKCAKLEEELKRLTAERDAISHKYNNLIKYINQYKTD